MDEPYRYTPGDVLRQKRDWLGRPKGTHALMIGHDNGNYVIIPLSKGKLCPYSQMPSLFTSDRLYEKVGNVDLDSLPVEISDLVEFAAEDCQLKWTGPPDLSALRGCDVLKQYMVEDEVE